MTSAPFPQLDRPKVLIVALQGIGNLLMASPLFRALKDANPTAEIDVLVGPRGTADIVEGNPRIRQILRGSAKPSLAEWRAMINNIKRERYDVGMIVHPGQLVMSAALLSFGGVHHRIGHRYTWVFLRQTGLFFTDPVPVTPHRPLALADRTAHDVVQNLNLLKLLGIKVPAPRSPVQERSSLRDEVGYDFPLTPDDRARADAWVSLKSLADARLVGLHPGAHRDLDVKRWPADRWSKLGDRMSERYDATVLVFGGPDEEPLKAEVCARMKAQSVSVEAPLRMTAALIARCALFIANDTGLMHAAVSQHVQTFGLFGPTDERRTAPWGTMGHVIRAPGTRPTYDVARLRSVRERHETDPSLHALGVETVAQEISAAVPALA